MIEVADLEAQGLIKTLDAAYTWPHPTDKGYFVSAIFVRTEKDEPYLIYCPKISSAISINEEQYTYAIWGESPVKEIRKLDLHQNMASINGVHFLIFPLQKPKPKEVKKEDIEKMFGVKVV